MAMFSAPCRKCGRAVHRARLQDIDDFVVAICPDPCSLRSFRSTSVRIELFHGRMYGASFVPLIDKDQRDNETTRFY
jgi:hypothetical protein